MNEIIKRDEYLEYISITKLLDYEIDQLNLRKYAKEIEYSNCIVIGLGGAGLNTINRLIDNNMIFEDYIAIDRDSKALSLCKAYKKIVVQNDNEVNCEAMEYIAKHKIVYIIAGLGGKTGGRLLTKVSKYCKDMNMYVVNIIFKPFLFEGRKMEMSTETLKQNVDAQYIYSNDSILSLAGRVSIPEAFNIANDWVIEAIKEVWSSVKI